MDEQRMRFEQALDDARRAAALRAWRGTRRTAPRFCATRASGTTTSGPASCSTAPCRPRWRRRVSLTPALSLRSRVVCGQAHPRGRDRRLRRAVHCRWPTAIAVVPAGYADGLDLRLAGRGFVLVSGPARTNRRRGQHGHDHDRRHRPRGVDGRRSRDHRRAGRRSHRRARDGRHGRNDSLGSALPHRQPHRTVYSRSTSNSRLPTSKPFPKPRAHRLNPTAAVRSPV